MSVSRKSAAINGVAATAAAGLLVLGALGFDARAADPAIHGQGDGSAKSAARERDDPADPTVGMAAEADAMALQAAVKPGMQAAVNWAGDAQDWARPTFAAVKGAAADYEPKFKFQMRRQGQGSEAQVQVSLGKAEAPRSPANIISRLGFIPQPMPAAVQKKGRMFLFAAVNTDAVGYNILRGPEGELRRVGFSAEKLAASGESQAGIGWRKGPVQASFGYIERRISEYGAHARQRFLGFTFSFRPSRAPSTRSLEDERRARYQGYPNQARAP